MGGWRRRRGGELAPAATALRGGHTRERGGAAMEGAGARRRHADDRVLPVPRGSTEANEEARLSGEGSDEAPASCEGGERGERPIHRTRHGPHFVPWTRHAICDAGRAVEQTCVGTRRTRTHASPITETRRRGRATSRRLACAVCVWCRVGAPCRVACTVRVRGGTVRRAHFHFSIRLIYNFAPSPPPISTSPPSTPPQADAPAKISSSS